MMPAQPSPSHKPRKKHRILDSSTSANGCTTQDATQQEQAAFPLVAFLWPARSQTLSAWVVLPSILMITGLYRWCIGFWPYSGYQNPPMHGDFEAQRHWMEVTTNLPVTHWYFHDLEWWGLDYPPLTAYHAWLVGKIGSFVQPDWFALYQSRKLDSQDLKVFMRGSVLASEYAIYIPAVVICAQQLSRISGLSTWESRIALTAVLMQPATMLIDHGHFQYNTVMLGFFVAAMASMLSGRRLWSCFFFVSALGFKQMALFYAPAVAAYLAGTCIFPRIDISGLFSIAIITLSSFGLLFLPLLLGTANDTRRGLSLPSDATIPPLLTALPFTVSSDAFYYPYIVQLAQSIHRIFPFARGLFEDKVANIWCAIHSSGIHKLNRYDSGILSKASLALTLCSIAPPCALIFFKPRKDLLLYAFATTAWGFFMCSYQVHEKNVLLPLLPMTLLLSTKHGMKPSTRAWVGYANLVACWTMFPLLTRDGLRIPYTVITLLWAWLMGLPPASIDAYLVAQQDGGLHIFSKLIHLLSYAAILVWHGMIMVLEPPANKPDLWVVANVCIGAAAFGMCYLWCLWRMIEVSQLLSSSKRTTPAKKQQ